MNHLKFKTPSAGSWSTATNPLLADRCLKEFNRFSGQLANTISTIIAVIPLSKPLSRNAISLINKIESFSKLKENWDSYGAIAPPSATLDKAKQFIRLLDNNNFPLYFVAPGPNGEIMIELKKGKYSAEVEFDSDGKFSARYFINDQYSGESLEENIALISLQAFLANDGRS